MMWASQVSSSLTMPQEWVALPNIAPWASTGMERNEQNSQ